MKRFLTGLLVVLAVLTLASCKDSSGPTATQVTPSPSPIATPSPTPSATPIATPTPTPIATLSPTPSATPSPTPIPTTPAPSKISPEAAKSILETVESAVFVDVRPKTDYDKEHIPGAISIPFEELQNRYGEIPAESQIIVYAECLR